MKIDLDELERTARQRAMTDGTACDHILALTARIRELEASLGRAIDGWNFADRNDDWRTEMDAERAILEKGAVLP